MSARRPSFLLLAAIAAAAAGCAPRTAYLWGDYDAVLSAHYANPQDSERYLERLGQIVQKAEVEKDRIPPGLYAEYGYALFEAGRLDEALTYYRKEREEWEESRVFMDKMIRNTRRLKENRPGPAPGGELPPPAGVLPGAAPAGEAK